MTGEPLRIALVGFGRIMAEDHLPAVTASAVTELVAVCDPDAGALERLPDEVPTYASVTEMCGEVRPDAAIVAVPHHQYLPVIRVLAEQGVHVLKEKPLAVSLEEAEVLVELTRRHKVKLMVTLQRRYNPIFRTYEQFAQYIGRLVHFDFRYTMNIPRLDLGWRADRKSAGGGCLIDMGYHTIDLLAWYFGQPTSVQALISQARRDGQQYDVEDTALMTLRYDRPEPFYGSVYLSRIGPSKEERLTITGSKGFVEIDRLHSRRRDQDGHVVEELSRSGEWVSSFLDQLNTFVSWVRDSPGVTPKPDLLSHAKRVAVIEAGYLSAETGAPVSPAALLDRHPALRHAS